MNEWEVVNKEGMTCAIRAKGCSSPFVTNLFITDAETIVQNHNGEVFAVMVEAAEQEYP